MSQKSPLSRILLATAGFLLVGNASAAVITWTDWTSISGSRATGIMGGTTVTADGLMDGPTSQTGCGTNFWTGTAYTNGGVSNAPTNCEQVSLNSATSITVTFSSAVNTLYMALLSVGQAGLAVTYDFDQPFSIDSEGLGFFGDDATNGLLGAGDTLTMREFHGVLRFAAPVTRLSFTTAPAENWHAFTFGTPAGVVPEPTSLTLLGLGLGLGLAGLGFRRREKV